MLLETGQGYLRAVATDGHRLALCQADISGGSGDEQQVIVPRKGVLELQRLVSGEGPLNIELGPNHVRIEIDGIRFTSKLIDGRFPPYERVIPADASNLLTADKDTIRRALQRTAILSNEKYRGIRLDVSENNIKIQAHNPEQEEAIEEIDATYSEEDLVVGFNVTYILDVLNVLDSTDVAVMLSDANSSALINQPGTEDCRYVVMPMRL
jgi:DNA polymerase-3 subunit beta